VGRVDLGSGREKAVAHTDHSAWFGAVCASPARRIFDESSAVAARVRACGVSRFCAT
jgi:hypothetical protein